MRFQVLVYAGSMLPTSRQARIAEADTLFAMGGIDRAALTSMPLTGACATVDRTYVTYAALASRSSSRSAT